jgi:GT2 family glycosyltransferase
MMVRRAAFDSLGGFDPRYFLYYEDVDLCARAARRGMATWYVKEARARHLGGGSSAQESGMALALHIASRLVYCRTHFGRGWQFALGLACAVEACLRLTRGLLSGNLAGVLTAYALLLRRGFTGVPIAARRIAPGAGAA